MGWRLFCFSVIFIIIASEIFCWNRKIGRFIKM